MVLKKEEGAIYYQLACLECLKSHFLMLDYLIPVIFESSLVHSFRGQWFIYLCFESKYFNFIVKLSLQVSKDGLEYFNLLLLLEKLIFLLHYF